MKAIVQKINRCVQCPCSIADYMDNALRCGKIPEPGTSRGHCREIIRVDFREHWDLVKEVFIPDWCPLEDTEKSEPMRVDVIVHVQGGVVQDIWAVRDEQEADKKFRQVVKERTKLNPDDLKDEKFQDEYNDVIWARWR